MTGFRTKKKKKKSLLSSIIQIMTKQQPCGFIVYLNFQALELSVSRGSSLSYNIVGICNKAANTVIRPRAKHWEGVLFRIYNRRFSQRSLHNNTSSTWRGYELISLPLSQFISHCLSSLHPCFPVVWPGSPSLSSSCSLLSVSSVAAWAGAHWAPYVSCS